MRKNKLTTKQVAQQAGYHVKTVYEHYKNFGHFHNVTPRKRLNGRLEWPAEAVNALLQQQGA